MTVDFKKRFSPTHVHPLIEVMDRRLCTTQGCWIRWGCEQSLWDGKRFFPYSVQVAQCAWMFVNERNCKSWGGSWFVNEQIIKVYSRALKTFTYWIWYCSKIKSTYCLQYINESSFVIVFWTCVLITGLFILNLVGATHQKSLSTQKGTGISKNMSVS